MPTLTIHLPGRPPVEHVLRTDLVTLGRRTGNGIVLDDDSVSQVHAEITCVAGEYFLRDRQSTNGTAINGQSVAEARLRNGDLIKFGQVTALFSSAVGAASSPKSVADSPAAKAETTLLSVKAKTSVIKPAASVASSAPVPTPVAQPQRPPEVRLQKPPEPQLAPEALPPPPPAARPQKRKGALSPVRFMVGVAIGLVVFLVWKLTTGGPVRPLSVKLPEAVTEPVRELVQEPVAPITNAVQPKAEPTTNALPTTLPEPPPVAEEVTNAPVQAEADKLPELLTLLRSSSVTDRRLAAREINALGEGAKSVVISLRLAVLQDSDSEVRAWLVLALVQNQTYEPATLPVLINALSHENPELRRRASAALALIPLDAANRPTAVAALKFAATDENQEVRREALAALKKVAPEVETGK